MSKSYNRSQFHSVMTQPVFGAELHKFGLPFTNIAGTISRRESKEVIDSMLLAVEWYPELHIVSFMENDEIYNRYVEGARYYWLFRGDKDPDIMFTSVFSYDDFSHEEIDKMNQFYKDFSTKPPSKKAMMYVQNQLNRLTSSKK
jgi:hypothetical protein